MRKNGRKLLALSTLGLVCLALGLTSCKSSNGGGGGGGSTTIEIEAPKYKISSDADVESAFNTEHFTAYLYRGTSSNRKWATTKGRGVLISGESVNLYLFGVPDDFIETEMGVSIYKVSSDGKYSESSDFSVSDDGVITCPEVSEKTDYRIYAIISNGESRFRKAIDVSVVPQSMVASSSEFDYTGRSGSEREVMAGLVEKSMLNNGIAPISTYNSGGYQLYHARIKNDFLEANNYVPGYGYGILTYSTIDEGLEAEDTDAWKTYLHSLESAKADEGNFNYLNSNSSSTADFYDYISTSYFDTYVNAEGTGTQYEGVLSRTDSPIGLDENGNVTTEPTNIWKVQVRVGGDADGLNGVTKGLAYRTASSTYSEFDGRNIQLKDYLTPLKLLATQSIGWYRGAEQAAESTANRQLKGFAEFYKNSAKDTELVSDEEFQKQVGVKLDYSDNSITFTFNGNITSDYAEYQINSLWSNPICEEFIEALGSGDAIAGAKIMGKTSGSLSPLDTMLCVGPYYTEYYENKKAVCFKKNENWPADLLEDNSGRALYQIDGIHLEISTAVDDDTLAYITKFVGGEVDYSNIPTKYWDQYVTDPRRKKVEGSSLSQFFVNTWDQVFWDSNFYDAQGKPMSDWDVKEALANINFYKALYVGIDRDTIASYYHKVADASVQEPVNKASPKMDHTFDASDANKEAFEDAFGNQLDTNQFVNWKTNAAYYFMDAIKEELEAGHYELGTASNPTVISMTIASNNTTGTGTLNEHMGFVFEDWKEAFELAVKTYTNSNGKYEWLSGGDKNGSPLITFSPTVEQIQQSTDSAMQTAVIYDGVKAGKYDGQCVYYVSGNGYDVLNNFEKYKSDDSSAFTLNFGAETGVITTDIYYEGMYWSFDSLWGAANIVVTLDEFGNVTK